MTDRCNDPRCGKLLYAYELGMLDDSEREMLELHLLECDYCFARVEKFSGAAGLFRESKAVKELAARQGVNRVEGEDEDARGPIARIWGSAAFKISLAAAALLIFLVLHPWQLEFRPTQEAVAAESRLAVLRFDNLTNPDDPDRLGAIISRLLITGLSESRFMSVVSDQRIQDVQELLNAGGHPQGDSDRALEVARKVSARWLLTGSVFQTTDGLRLESHLIDVGTGVVSASEEVIGPPDETIFALVDRLGRQIRTDLALPDDARKEVERPVTEVTTSSTEAYRSYVEGIEYTERNYVPEAVAAFHKSIEYDSTFAMAYYYLAILGIPDMITRAVEYSGKSSWLEQRYILALAAQLEKLPESMITALHEILERYPDEKDADYRLGTYYWSERILDSAVSYFNKAIEVDSLFRGAYNYLAYSYSEAGDLDKAVWAINKYIALAPQEANPYDTRGDLYAVNDNLEQAAQSYQRALDIKPDFWVSAFKFVGMRIFQGRYREADSLLRPLEGVDNLQVRVLARLYETLIPIRQGKFEQALSEIDSGIVKTEMDPDTGARISDEPGFYVFKARIRAEQGRYDLALAALDTAMIMQRKYTPNDTLSCYYLYAQYLAANGDFKSAEEVQRRLAAHTKTTGQAPCYQYWAAGSIELARGNLVAAVEQFEKGAELTSVTYDFVANNLLARAYLASGKLGQAVPLLEKLESVYSTNRLVVIIDDVKLHYYLGIAYEESRWYDRAAQEYRTFLDLWKDANPGLTAVEDARQRLARLRI